MGCRKVIHIESRVPTCTRQPELSKELPYAKASRFLESSSWQRECCWEKQILRDIPSDRLDLSTCWYCGCASPPPCTLRKYLTLHTYGWRMKMRDRTPWALAGKIYPTLLAIIRPRPIVFLALEYLYAIKRELKNPIHYPWYNLLSLGESMVLVT